MKCMRLARTLERDYSQKMPSVPHHRATFFKPAPDNPRNIGMPEKVLIAPVRFAGIWVLLFFVFVFALLPLQARSFSGLGQFTVSDEIELGRKFNVLVRSRLPLVEDPEILGYTENLLDRLHRQMPQQPFPITVGVIRHGALNAFAGPGGHVFVHTGLFQNLENESAFAGVLAHELAHVSQRHIAARIEKAQWVNIGTLLGVLAGALLGGDAAPALLYGSLAAGQSAMLAYSREDEREADQVGMNYLTAAGFSPKGMVESFETIRRLRWLGGSIPVYFSTHPGVDERITYLKDRVDRMPAELRQRTDDNKAYQRARMLVMAKYTEPDQALAFFHRQELDGCLNILGRAIVFERHNRIGEARVAFERALACAPQDPLLLREAGAFFLQQGDFEQAEKLLQQAIQCNPRDQMSLYHYARVLVAQDQRDQAIPLLKQILGRLPEQSAVHAYLGRLLGQVGRLFEAHLHLGYASIYTNDKKQADFHIQRAEENARTDLDRAELAAQQRVYKERAEFW